jgi:hypothetical protein
VELLFSGVEWSMLRCLDKILWSGAKFGGVESVADLQVGPVGPRHTLRLG